MSNARLPINYGDTGKLSRDKINDSFNELSATVQGYRPHIESGVWWIGNTNTGVKAVGDSVEMRVEDGYIRYKSDSANWTKIIAVNDLKGDQGDQGEAATITIGSTTTGAAGSDACVTNSGTTGDAVLNFTIPRGATGCTGATGASICAAEFCGDDMVFTKDDGCTVTLSGAKTDLKGADGCPGCNGCNGCDGQDGASICAAAFSGNDIVFTEDNGCTVTLTGAKTDLKGDTGDAATITVGTTTTGDAGTCASVSNSGTTCAAVLNFTIPKGATGDTGNGIYCVTSCKEGKTTTVTMCYTNGGSDCFTVDDGDSLTAGTNIDITNAKVSAENYFIIKESDTCTTYTKTKGVDPYNTCYCYTNICINPDSGVKWKEGAIYTFVIDSQMLATSACRNVRVKIGDGDYIPVMGSSAILSGCAYFVKTQTRQYQYSTKYQACGALHLFTDSNTTYSAMSTAEIDAGTCTCARNISPCNLKYAIQHYSPTDNCQLANSCGFITNAVNDLTNYYLKCETYKKCEVDNLISNFGGFEVVSTLPTQNIKTNVIYLKGPIGTGTDRYEEWIYYSSTWTQIGETSVDLTNYAKCCDIPTDNCQLANSCGFTTCTGTLVASDLNGYAQTNSLCTVATSGKYCDLTGKPTLCAVATSGKYCDLTGQPTKLSCFSNDCGYTTCTGTLTNSSLKTINGCCLVGSGDICIQGGGGCSEWGCITGTLCDQTDLQGALDCKVNVCCCVNSHGEVSERSISTKSASFSYDNGVGTTYSVTICNKGCVNAFKECCDGGGCGIHLGTDCLGYEQLDENWDTECGFSLTAGGICSYGNCVTARCYPFDGACRIATLCDLPAESNTKTFCMACSNDLVTAQAAYDWYKAGNNPIICYCQRSYITSGKDGNHLPFTSTNIYSTDYNSYGCTQDLICIITLCSADGTNVCSTYVGSKMAGNGYLTLNHDYTCPYTPQYAGSPTTKKYVDECVVYKCSTAPSTPTEGLVWYDTSSDILKTYDGSNWNAVGGGAGSGDVTGPASSTDCHIAVFDGATGKIIKDGGPIPEGKVYCEGVGIDIEERERRDRQGPTPEGFHVPSTVEWQNLVGILTTTFSLSPYAATMGTYLKMPVAGYRCYSSSCVCFAGTRGDYWASTATSNSCAYYLYIHTSSDPVVSGTFRSPGKSIRAFKDEPVVPDETWTMLYDGSDVAAGAGVFCNSTLGLISVSGDGTTWYTIQDKNLGATTVYNNGDTRTDANMGCFYQWGNNYGFPYSGTITTSATQVDASSYGPGNYYCCDVFITGSYDWSCVQNDNLWGSVTNCCTSLPFINNTGVTSVNGCMGDVSVSIPEYNEGPGICIGDYKDYSAVRGPAPVGFHTPSALEWTNVMTTAKSTLGICCECVKSCFKLPTQGYMSSLGEICGPYTFGDYRTVTPHSSCGQCACLLDNNYGTISYSGRAHGYAVRAFKDEPVVPDETWTTIHDGSACADGAGIFWNCDECLISISGDGETWTTIADRNIGAAEAGVTCSAFGCYFQWGNNYGFPYSGPECASFTTLNASCYGPGNNYCCNVFVRQSVYWDSSCNNDLWGGVTGITCTYNGITNTGVLSVNRQTGNVNICVVESIDGRKGDVCLKTVNGCGLVGSGDICIEGGGSDYTAGEGIRIAETGSPARRGPLQKGYHIPLNSEWACLLCAGASIGARDVCGDGYKCGCVRNMLHLPTTGYINGSNGAAACWTSNKATYWSSDDLEGYSAYGCMLQSNSYCVFTSTWEKSLGMPIRGFKDTPAIPDSSWTTIYDGSACADGAGVFWSELEGLISVSSDGTNWITIQDKNLGATTVWSWGGSVSATNSGCYYQWGNNYGFPYSGPVNTSNARQQTEGYGPGNYYCCDTFVLSAGGWECTSCYINSNLRGGDAGMIDGTTISNTGVISETVVSGDTGCTYTIKVSNTAPGAGTPNTTITFVTGS